VTMALRARSDPLPKSVGRNAGVNQAELCYHAFEQSMLPPERSARPDSATAEEGYDALKKYARIFRLRARANLEPFDPA